MQRALLRAILIVVVAESALPVRPAVAQTCVPATLPPFAPTIWSVANGPWISPATWNLARVPVPTDLVLISPGTTVGMNRAYGRVISGASVSGRFAPIPVAGLLVAGNLVGWFPMSQAAGKIGEDVAIITPVALVAATGMIAGQDGSKPPNSPCAMAFGGWVILRTPGAFSTAPAPGFVINNGIITGGRGGSDGGSVLIAYPGSPVVNNSIIGTLAGELFPFASPPSALMTGHNFPGGSVTIAGAGLVNNCSIAGGRGLACANRCGSGGSVVFGGWTIWNPVGPVVGAGTATNNGQIVGGWYANGCPGGSSYPFVARGGDVTFVAGGAATNNGLVSTSWGSIDCGVVHFSGSPALNTSPYPLGIKTQSCWLDQPPFPPAPFKTLVNDPPVVQITGGTVLSGGKMDISASALIEIGNLTSSPAIDSQQSILLNVCPGGTLDLRNNAAGIIRIAAHDSITIKADNILLDPGVTLSDIMSPPPSVLPGDRYPELCVMPPAAHMQVEPGTTFDHPYLVMNCGNKTEAVQIDVNDPLGWATPVSVAHVLDPLAHVLIMVHVSVPPDAAALTTCNIVLHARTITPGAVSDLALSLETPAAAGDMNCDGAVNVLDINPFILALLEIDPFPGCQRGAADTNDDNVVDADDIVGFLARIIP